VKDYLAHPEIFEEFIGLTKPYIGKENLRAFYYQHNCQNILQVEGKFWKYIWDLWLATLPSPNTRKGQPKSKSIIIDFDAEYGTKWHLKNYVLPSNSFWNPQDLIDHGFRKINVKEIVEYKNREGEVFLKGGLAVNIEYKYYADSVSVGSYELDYIYSPIKWIKDPDANKDIDLIKVSRDHAQLVEEEEKQRAALIAAGRLFTPTDSEPLHVYSCGGWDELWGD
jgi:hypothetical protein